MNAAVGPSACKGAAHDVTNAAVCSSFIFAPRCATSLRLRSWRLRLLQRSTSLVLVLVKQEFYFLLKCETFQCCQLCLFHPDVRASKFLPKRSQDDIIAFEDSEGIART